MYHSLPQPTKKSYQQRRQKIFAQMAMNSIAIIATADHKLRYRDNHYPFQPDRDFYYLTGFAEPQAIAVLIKAESQQFILFNRAKNSQQERWQGYFAGQQGAMENYDADQSYDITEFEQQLPQLLLHKECLYTAWSAGNHTVNQRLFDILRAESGQKQLGTVLPVTTRNIDPLLHEMRLLKDIDEIALLSYAAEVSVQAHIATMQRCKPELYEYQLQAEFTRVLQQHGCLQYAYEPIIAGGNNACILHYNANNQQLLDNTLLLIDAAGEYQYYAADITRTYPVNGKFSGEQRAIYELVLQAQRAAMSTLKVGSHRQQFIEITARTISEGLLDLGILEGDLETVMAEKSYQPFYCHSPGHWLGLEVHDVGSYIVDNSARPFIANMVTTNEPGIYIPHGSKQVNSRWWGIGVRIEDEVLITEQGPRVLSEDLPTAVADIEALMAGQ